MGKMLEMSKESLSSEKYRDELAGAQQHFSNGLWPALVGLDKDRVIDLPCFQGTALQAAQEAVRRQRISCSLRSQKYASPKSSKSHVFSYKSSLEGLANACEVLDKLDPTADHELNTKIIIQLRSTAENLSMLKDHDLLKAVENGDTISAEANAICSSERRAANNAMKMLPKTSANNEFDSCLQCRKKPPTLRGTICKCKCLCGDCYEEEELIECPNCKELTEFMYCVPKEGDAIPSDACQ